MRNATDDRDARVTVIESALAAPTARTGDDMTGNDRNETCEPMNRELRAPRRHHLVAALMATTGFAMSNGAMAQAPVLVCPVAEVNLSNGVAPDFNALDDGSIAFPVNPAIFPNGIAYATAHPLNPQIGQPWQSYFINTNGNLTFGQGYTIYTPSALPGLAQPTIAPYFGDFDLRASPVVTNGDAFLCEDTINNQVMITWEDVLHYNATATTTLNTATVQVILRDVPNVCNGIPGVEVEFRYEVLDWHAGTASGSGLDGLCALGPPSCFPAVAGFDLGNVVTGYQIPGSGTLTVHNDLLTTTNVGVNGVWNFVIPDGGGLQICGDGTVNVCEECDDGGESATCNADCTFSACGDGVLNTTAGEVCDDGNTTGGDGCSANCLSTEICGNGILDPGEACDDGNTTGGDGCSADCTSDESCGNGILDPGEACDDGNATDGDGCSADCSSDESCGNGILDPGEACDDGNTTDGDGCSADCSSDENCGNGILDPGEACDDGNTTDGDGCNANCTSDESCGNGVLDLGETCDDGNNVDGDGCSADCTSNESCGNGLIDLGEECDDGGESAICNADCTIAMCGDGIVNVSAGEECDGGPGCSPECTLPLCGNGVIDPGEACDDGNDVAGDGCSPICQIEGDEEGICGDGVLDPGEACDDGNTESGDGCSSTCGLETDPPSFEGDNVVATGGCACAVVGDGSRTDARWAALLGLIALALRRRRR
jgi:MYXO-CTERM domain-containing protein